MSTSQSPSESPTGPQGLIRSRSSQSGAITRFSRIPWCTTLLTSPLYEPIPTATRTPKSNAEDAFFAETLSTDRTIKHILTLRPKNTPPHPPAASPSSSPAAAEASASAGIEENETCLTILEIGPGVNGHPGLCHGGFVATLLDEVFGLLITMRRKQGELGGREMNHVGLFTAYLHTTYKAPIPTPNTILVTATLVKKTGRKRYVAGTVSNGMGKIYATGEALFIESESRGKL